MFCLCLCTSTVDTRGGLGTVSTKEGILNEIRKSQGKGQVTFQLQRVAAKLTLSKTRTLPPRSRMVCAADSPLNPPPTTITFAMAVYMSLFVCIEGAVEKRKGKRVCVCAFGIGWKKARGNERPKRKGRKK